MNTLLMRVLYFRYMVALDLIHPEDYSTNEELSTLCDKLTENVMNFTASIELSKSSIAEMTSFIAEANDILSMFYAYIYKIRIAKLQKIIEILSVCIEKSNKKLIKLKWKLIVEQ